MTHICARAHDTESVACDRPLGHRGDCSGLLGDLRVRWPHPTWAARHALLRRVHGHAEMYAWTAVAVEWIP